MHSVLQRLQVNAETTCIGNLITHAIAELDRSDSKKLASIYTLASVGRNIFELFLILDYILKSGDNMRDWIGQKVTDEIQVLECLRLFSDIPNYCAWTAKRISSIREIASREGISETKYKNPSEYARLLGRMDEYDRYYKIFSKFTHPSSWVINENKKELESSPFRVFFIVKTERYLLEILGRVAAYIDARVKTEKSE